MINGFVAISGHQELSAGLRTGADGRKNTAGAAIDQAEALSGAEKPGGPFLELKQNPFGMMEIVKIRDFRQVNGPGIGECQRAPFVARHVKGIIVALAV